MVAIIEYDKNNFKNCFKKVFSFGENPKYKVFLLKANDPPENVQEFYTKNFKNLGTPFRLGEDATKLRQNQKNGSIWFEVRNDKSIPNAYRHSTNSQPLLLRWFIHSKLSIIYIDDLCQ